MNGAEDDFKGGFHFYVNFGESDLELKSGDEHFVEFFDNGLQGVLAEDAVGDC